MSPAHGIVGGALVLLVFIGLWVACVEWLRESRRRRRVDAHPGPLPQETYARFTEPTATREALERLYALDAVEPPHPRFNDRRAS